MRGTRFVSNLMEGDIRLAVITGGVGASTYTASPVARILKIGGGTDVSPLQAWEASTRATALTLLLLHSSPERAREQRICLQPRPSRACLKRCLENFNRFFAWPRGNESSCNILRCYTRSLNTSKTPASADEQQNLQNGKINFE